MTDMADNNNEPLHEEEEEESNKDPELKQAAEIHQPSSQPNIK